MDLGSNPFIVLSYVSGPALLTNATSLLLLSTTNRFGRTLDRSRELAARLSDAGAHPRAVALDKQMVMVQRRARYMARALFGLYLSVAMFALATLGSIIGAALAEVGFEGSMLAALGLAMLAGLVGFVALASAAISMVAESRLAMQSLALEADEAASSTRPRP